ncbi:MAG: hypothetical protein ACKV19_27035, partial [Verrucomicrobiales bacterium]
MKTSPGEGSSILEGGARGATRKVPDDSIWAHRFLWLWAPLEKAEGSFFHHAPTADEPGRS